MKSKLVNNSKRTPRKKLSAVKKVRRVRKTTEPRDNNGNKHLVILDGSNVAFFHSNHNGFSVKGLEIALNEIINMGYKAIAIVPEFRLNPGKTTDPGLLKMLVDSELVKLVCKNTTARCFDDFHILTMAQETDGAIVSNDNYLKEAGDPNFRAIIESRVIPFMFFKDKFMLPLDPYGENGPILHSILNK